MLQRVSIVTSEQKPVNTILMNLQPIRAPSSVHDVIAIRSPSGTPHFRINAGRAPKNRRGKTAQGGGKAETQS